MLGATIKAMRAPFGQRNGLRRMMGEYAYRSVNMGCSDQKAGEKSARAYNSGSKNVN
jgi:hypothetical protein